MPPARHRALCLAACIGAAALAPVGCASSSAADAARRGDYQSEAEARYEAGMRRFRAEEWPEAQEAFRQVREEHAGTRWGYLAELRLADIDFRQERYSEALTGYRTWIRYHPNQAEAGHAHFMIARCYVAQMPEDWFLVPPTWERDLSSVRDAEGALSRFVRDHGDASAAPEARRLLADVRRVLARHELYVAEFYASRERWNAAITRLITVVSAYDDVGISAPALLRLGELYLRAGQVPEARGAFSMLSTDHSATAQADAARRHLGRLGEGPTTPVDLSLGALPSTRPARSGSGDGSTRNSRREGR